MQQNEENKLINKSKLLVFYNNNKLKIYLLIFLFTVSLISLFSIKIYNENKSYSISEKYIQAGLYFTLKKKEQSIILYEEIILSKNKFYSILALNEILEKDLVADSKDILNFFKIIESIKLPNEQKDIIVFKKALYLIKINNSQEGQLLLKHLIDKNSKIKFLAKEILVN